MRDGIVLPLLAASLLTAGPAAAQLQLRGGRVCHDLVVVGEVKAYGEFLSYYEMDPTPDETALYVGGRRQMTVRVERVLDGRPLPRMIEVRALMASAYRLPVTMVLYLQREARGTYWAADWTVVKPDSRGRVATPDRPPPRCER
ncbi:MAG TPA: hypothetical protein PLF78_01420 [Caulobacter sp.]|nr:hypothetical protein [Caulobacter sp.]